MSESVEFFGALKDMRKRERELFGQPCPECVAKLPRAHPTILTPQQRCRIHGYRDPRPLPTNAEWEAAMNGDSA